MSDSDVSIAQQLRTLAREFLADNKVRAANRAALDGLDESRPDFWPALSGLGLLAVHLPAEYGGGDSDWEHLVIVLEELGAVVAPGPLVPAVVVGDLLARRASDSARDRWLPGLVEGSLTAALGVTNGLRRVGNRIAGDAGAVLGAGAADVLAVPCGDDIVLVDRHAAGVNISPVAGVDPGLHVARVRFDAVDVGADDVVPGARRLTTALFRLACAAQAGGGARACLDGAVDYAKTRHQFGRPIGSFQAVKHLCADMLIEVESTAATVWDAARQAAGDEPGFAAAAAAAAAVALPAYLHNARTAIQVYGGIGYTWEHDAQLYYRRAIALTALAAPSEAARDVARLWTPAFGRDRRPRLPQSIEAQRPGIRARLEAVTARPEPERRAALTECGLAMPEMPEPWGIGAPPALQLLIRQEFARAGIEPPGYGITGWVVASLIQYGTPEQVRRWVEPAMTGSEIWCQLFSEPEAGSDAAAVRARGVRVAGGWTVSGQKVWTTLAHRSAYGLATVRTDPDAAKHAGITTMVIDLSAPGVTVRPLRQISGEPEFNEVWLDEVFVPDTDVIGAPGEGWRVARTTFGNERLSLGRGHTDEQNTEGELVGLLRADAERAAYADQVGRFLARAHAARMINLKWAERAVTVAPPGAEGNITKMLRAESLQRLAEIELEMLGPAVAEGDSGSAGAMAAFRWLDSPRASIAGGTSEITRTQIAERILGLPRERYV